MFLNNPNLPQKKVNSVLIDYRAEKAKKALVIWENSLRSLALYL